MVKLQAPLQSLEASGTLGQVLTFNKQKRGTTLRKRPTPSQPRSPSQVRTRAMLQFLCTAWSTISSGSKATWSQAYPATDLNAYNAFTKYNMHRFTRYATPSSDFPPTETGTPPSSIAYNAYGSVRRIKHMVQYITSIGHLWAIAVVVKRDTWPFFNLDTLVHIIPVPTSGWKIWYQERVPAGFYRMHAIPFMWQGNIDWSLKKSTQTTVT